MSAITHRCYQINRATRMTIMIGRALDQISRESAHHITRLPDTALMITNIRYGWWVAGCSAVIEIKARQVEAVTHTLRREGLTLIKLTSLLAQPFHRQTDRQIKRALIQCRYPFGAIGAISAYLIQRDEAGRTVK